MNRPDTPHLLNRPSRQDLGRLLRTPEQLCVSVLVNTTPGPRLCDTEAEILEAHLRDVRRRLEWEATDTRSLRRNLDQALDSLRAGPVDKAVAIFATVDSVEVFHLGVTVVDRVVIDPTFATRDVVRAVHANPAFDLLLIDHRAASLFRYDQKFLLPELSAEFPVLREGRVSSRDTARLRGFLRTVDSNLSRCLDQAGTPLVIVSRDKVLAEFLNLTRNGHRVAGFARSVRSRPSLAELEAIGRTGLADHVIDLRMAAADTAQARLRRGRAVTGLLDAWWAAATRTPEMLLVEEGLTLPARVTPDGKRLIPAIDAEHPDVIDDAVDDLIELVLARGGHVNLVPDGHLRSHAGVVLTLAR